MLQILNSNNITKLFVFDNSNKYKISKVEFDKVINNLQLLLQNIEMMLFKIILMTWSRYTLHSIGLMIHLVQPWY